MALHPWCSSRQHCRSCPVTISTGCQQPQELDEQGHPPPAAGQARFHGGVHVRVEGRSSRAAGGWSLGGCLPHRWTWCWPWLWTFPRLSLTGRTFYSSRGWWSSPSSSPSSQYSLRTSVSHGQLATSSISNLSLNLQSFILGKFILWWSSLLHKGPLLIFNIFSQFLIQ